MCQCFVSFLCFRSLSGVSANCGNPALVLKQTIVSGTFLPPPRIVEKSSGMSARCRAPLIASPRGKRQYKTELPVYRSETTAFCVFCTYCFDTRLSSHGFVHVQVNL